MWVNDMALDQEYFDSIHIDMVKKKYYNANKVEAVFADIRRQAAELLAENERLRQQLGDVGERKTELGDAVLSAQTVYQGIVEKAWQRSEEILSDAQEQRRQILEEAHRQQDYAVQRTERCFSEMRQQQQTALDGINAAWQAFLCDLYEKGSEPEREPESAPEREPEYEPEYEPEGEPEIDVPDDLEDQIDAIARELLALSGGQTE